MRILFLGITLNFFGVVAAQNVEKLTLSQCVNRALSMNLDVQLAQINQELALIDSRQSLYNMAPDLNGSAGQYYQMGRSIDRFSNQFVQSTIGSNNFQLQSSWVLFAGGQLRNALKQSQLKWKASQADQDQAKQAVALNVALAYLAVLQAKEQVAAADASVKNGSLEVERINTLLKNGASTEAALWSAKAQWSNQQSNLVQAQNQYSLSLVSLKNLLMLPIEANIELTATSLEIKDFNPVVSQLLDSAMVRRADIAAAKYRMQASQSSYRMAVGTYFPTLSIGANLNTVFSDNAKSITGKTFTGTTPIGLVQGSGQIVEMPVFAYDTKTIDFGKQVKDNFGQSFGATLSVPVFGKFQTQSQVKKAKLSIIQTNIQLEKTIQTVKNDVYTAYSNFSNAKNRYQAAQEALNAQVMNLKFVQARFSNGQASQFDLQTATNAENNARQSYISAQYEYQFRTAVLLVFQNGIEFLMTLP